MLCRPKSFLCVKKPIPITEKGVDKEEGVKEMEKKRDGRRDIVITNVEVLVSTRSFACGQ